jgi:hypothetical protein
VLLEERCSSNLLLTSSVALGHGAAASVGTRNILATNLVSINKSIDLIAGAKLDRCIAMSIAIVQCRDRKEESIGLFSAKTNCGYVALVGIHISADVITGVVLLADEIILFCEFYGQLSIGRKIYAQLTFGVVSGHAYSIAEYICQKQTVGIRVLTYVG